MAEFDINKVQGNDRFIAGGAVVLLVLSFFPWYSVSSDFPGGGSASENLWGVYGVLKLALLLALAAGAIVIARLMGALESVKLPAGVNLITLALSGVATVIFALRMFGAYKSVGSGSFEVSGHPGYGWYIGLAVSAAMTYFAFLNFKASGEQLPTTSSSSDPEPPPAPTP